MAQVVAHFPLNGVRNNRRRSDVSSFEVVFSNWRGRGVIGEVWEKRGISTCCVYGRIEGEV
jgi:hypothetical protein